jgi:hypothetical protein
MTQMLLLGSRPLFAVNAQTPTAFGENPIVLKQATNYKFINKVWLTIQN